MNIGIVGLGLMGGSLGRTLIKRTNHVVYGTDLSEAALEKAEIMSAFHKKLTLDNAKELDMLVISVFAGAFSSVADKYLPYLKEGAILIDFCGIKRPIINKMRELQKVRGDIVYVGGHPMAGREFSGVERSLTTLFDKASMILVPINADIFVLDSTKHFFLDLGFQEVVITDADNHDKMIAFTSQLCHVVSNAFIKNKTARKHFGYSAGSYKDLTRVARLNPKMWTDLMMNNGDNLASELDELIENLSLYRDALKQKDGEKLENLLSEGNEIKLAIDERSKKNGN